MSRELEAAKCRVREAERWVLIVFEHMVSAEGDFRLAMRRLRANGTNWLPESVELEANLRAEVDRQRERYNNLFKLRGLYEAKCSEAKQQCQQIYEAERAAYLRTRSIPTQPRPARPKKETRQSSWLSSPVTSYPAPWLHSWLPSGGFTPFSDMQPLSMFPGYEVRGER